MISLGHFRVKYPAAVKGVLEADQHQKILIRFVLQDEGSKNPTNVHQTFLKLTHKESAREIIFNVEKDSNGGFKFDLVGSSHHHHHYDLCPNFFDLKGRG